MEQLKAIVIEWNTASKMCSATSLCCMSHESMCLGPLEGRVILLLFNHGSLSCNPSVYIHNMHIIVSRTLRFIYTCW